MLDTARLANSVRTRRGSMSLRQAEEDSGISKSVLHAIEKEQTKPTLDVFARLCQWMDMPMDYFLDEDDDTSDFRRRREQHHPATEEA